MRRKDREVTEKIEIFEMMQQCDVCRVAFCNETYPYIVPMNFGVVRDGDTFKLYFHGATAGTKLTLLKANPHVGFEMDCNHKLVLGDKACEATMMYESICGNGVMRILPEEEKVAALTTLMEHYVPKEIHTFDENIVRAVEVLELTVHHIYGKRHVR